MWSRSRFQLKSLLRPKIKEISSHTKNKKFAQLKIIFVSIIWMLISRLFSKITIKLRMWRFWVLSGSHFSIDSCVGEENIFILSLLLSRLCTIKRGLFSFTKILSHHRKNVNKCWLSSSLSWEWSHRDVIMCEPAGISIVIIFNRNIYWIFQCLLEFVFKLVWKIAKQNKSNQ